MANKAQLGEIRTWKDGRKYQKTASGWVPVKSGSKGNTEQKEEPAKGRSSKESEGSGQDYQIKQGAWNEDIPVKDLPYAKGDVSYLKEKFPEAKVSAYIDDENEDHEVAMDIPLKNGNKISLSFYDDGKATVDYTSRDGENWTRDVDIYDESFDDIIDDAGYYDGGEDDNNTATSEGNGKQDSSQFQMIDPSTINDTSELYGKVPGLKNEEIDSYFDETYDYLKEEMSSSEEDDVFSEALADTVRWVNKQGRKASQEEGNQESQQPSYTPEQLSDYAKSASDEGLKRAASSGDEQMRVAAKREIARRKNEGMEAETDNPFDKGRVQKSQKEERIFKGQIYEKVDGGWIKKK